jgi:hypothetical protein
VAAETLEGAVCTKKASWQACVYLTSRVKSGRKDGAWLVIP